jgi:hypothetical protein
MTKIQILIWHVGKYSRIIRYLYWKISKHHWLWGIRGWLKDNYIADPKPCTADDIKEASEWLDKHAHEIFSAKDN